MHWEAGPFTALMIRTDPGKLGLFLMFLMTTDSTLSPPHSTTRLGEHTVASWYVFMLRRPHARICDQNPERETERQRHRENIWMDEFAQS